MVDANNLESSVADPVVDPIRAGGPNLDGPPVRQAHRTALERTSGQKTNDFDDTREHPIGGFRIISRNVVVDFLEVFPGLFGGKDPHVLDAPSRTARTTSARGIPCPASRLAKASSIPCSSSGDSSRSGSIGSTTYRP